MPKLQRLKDMGLAEHHLRNGYPDIWKIKNSAEAECNKIVNNIQDTYMEIEKVILTEIEKDILTIGNKLGKRPKNHRPKYIRFQSFYEDNIVTEIIKELSNHTIHGIPFKPVKTNYAFPEVLDDEGKSQSPELYLLSIGEEGEEIAGVKKEHVDEVNGRIKKLLSDTRLQALVSTYNKLRNDLNTNKNKNEFFEKIDNLYESVYVNGESLNEKGRCRLCPPRGWLNYF